MSDPRARYDEPKFSSEIPAERDRLVALLTQITARIHAAPLDQFADALPVLAAPADELSQAVDDLLGAGLSAEPVCVPGKGPNPCC